LFFPENFGKSLDKCFSNVNWTSVANFWEILPNVQYHNIEKQKKNSDNLVPMVSFLSFSNFVMQRDWQSV
jgi:hypothetical protein